MSHILEELVAILTLEKIEHTVFRGQSQNLGWGRVFGGQVLGQALSAATQTVTEERAVHSFHSYFLRSGDASKPIVYMVDPIRDGRSFSTRRVVALQDGKAIFNLSASFQVDEDGLSHQTATMPEVVKPDALKPEHELAERYISRLPEHVASVLPAAMREQAVAKKPIEIRPVNVVDPIFPKKSEPQRQVWFRTSDKLSDDPSLHRFLLAYASDFHFLVTAMQPHGVSWLTPGLQVASVDHAMWFHRPFRMDEWLLYTIDGPTAQSARGLVHGQIFDQSGALVASTAQEGLMRDRRASTNAT